MESERIARIARDAFLKEPLLRGFTDVRKRPQIPLQAILLSLFEIPLLGPKSLLSNDQEARTSRYKRLFGCDRKMVTSDSTFARVLKWLFLGQVKSFLLSFLDTFERRDLLRKLLSPKGLGSRNSGRILSRFFSVVRLEMPRPIVRSIHHDQPALLQHPIHDGFRKVMIIEHLTPGGQGVTCLW